MTARFNERADTYSQAAVVQRQLAEWLAEWLEPAEMLAPLSALELGAGDGMFTRRLAPRTGRLVAIDSAPRMVERGVAQLPHVQWRIGDAWQLAAEPVDRLYSASLLQWCEHPQQTLRRWRRLVKPGGRMLHGFYVSPTLAEWESLAGATPAVVWHTSAEWGDFFRAAGWEVARQEVRRHSFQFDSALSLLRFFHRTGAATPRGLGVGALRRLLRQYERRFRVGPLGVVSTWAFCRIEATC